LPPCTGRGGGRVADAALAADIGVAIEDVAALVGQVAASDQRVVAVGVLVLEVDGVGAQRDVAGGDNGTFHVGARGAEITEGKHIGAAHQRAQVQHFRLGGTGAASDKATEETAVLKPTAM
jgi:hypothetical protein